MIATLRTYLKADGEPVPSETELTGLPDEEYRALILGPRCFAEETRGEELLDALERANAGIRTPPVSLWLDRVVAKVAGVAVDEPVGFFVSRAAFSTDGAKALVYAEDRSPLAGFGAFFMLELQEDAWRVVDTCELWVS